MPSLLQRLQTSIVGFWPRDNSPQGPSRTLVPELTRYFLSEAIDDRVKFLANVGDLPRPKEVIFTEVFPEYSNLVEEGIRQQLKLRLISSHSYAPDKDLRHLQIPQPLTDDLWNSPEALIVLLQTRGMFKRGRMSGSEISALLGCLLSAVQQVTLDIVRLYYPVKGLGTVVPDGTQEILRRILRRLNELSQNFQVVLQKNPTKAETELRVLIARAALSACLPLHTIPTAALEGAEAARHFEGRPDEDQALTLSHQIRHADGTILVTGYRGVGKSTFVNRVKFHTLAAQKKVPDDGWLIVPVVVNLAKVAGVQNILRITLRAVRDALLEPDSLKPCVIPGQLKKDPLPLDESTEIEPLQEAVIRVTFRVTSSRSNASEKRVEAGSSFSLDPGKLLGPVIGLELGKFLEGGVKKTRTERINRELNLLDYDENAAEEDLQKLIRRLATPRPIRWRGPTVQIKLLFIFDELDKMDIEQGVKPMIEGLKNLFLEQHSVFVLVTSKKFYYELLKDRAKEDAILSSYFSSIVHVPLMSYAQAHKIVDDWVDWKATELLNTRTPEENNRVKRLARVLVYKSFGNPRDIIRELRRMQEWAETSQQPYLTDEPARSRNEQIIAAIQECIEQTLLPKKFSSPTTQIDSSAPLVFDRLAGDEARIEQIRRGLYILTEELITRQTLLLEDRPAKSVDEDRPATPDDDGRPLIEPDARLAIAETSPLPGIQKDNFSLFTIEEVQDLAKELGRFLSDVHTYPELFPNADWGVTRPLFTMQSEFPARLHVTNDFYELTGRQVKSAKAEPDAGAPRKKSSMELVAEATNLAAQEGWVAKLSALEIIKQLEPGDLTPDLEQFLVEGLTDEDTNRRLATVERLTPGLFFRKGQNIWAQIQNESDERVLAGYFRLLGKATDGESRKKAADAILGLFKQAAADPVSHKLTDSSAIVGLTEFQNLAYQDATSELLNWLSAAGTNEQVQKQALRTITTLAAKFGVDIADKIISSGEVLRSFTADPLSYAWGTFTKQTQQRRESELKTELRKLLRANPLKYSAKLLNADPKIMVDDLLAYIWEVAFQPDQDELAVHIFELFQSHDESSIVRARLNTSLRLSSEFQTRLLPYLRKQLPERSFSEAETKALSEELDKLESLANYKPDAFAQELLKQSQGALQYMKSKTSRRLEMAEQEFSYYRAAPSYHAAPSYEIPTSPRTIGILIAGFAVFVLGILFYKRDLPTGASFAQTVAGRLLLLVLDASIVLPLVYLYDQSLQSVLAPRSTSAYSLSYPSSTWKDLLKQNQSAIGLLIPLAVYGLISVHTKYFGPLSFWNQVFQFLINLPVIVLALYAFRSND